jgi:hypothetical protein
MLGDLQDTIEQLQARPDDLLDRCHRRRQNLVGDDLVRLPGQALL